MEAVAVDGELIHHLFGGLKRLTTGVSALQCGVEKIAMAPHDASGHARRSASVDDDEVVFAALLAGPLY